MPLLDASAVLDLWKNYPIGQFPTVWSWFQTEVQKGNLTIPSVALTEVGHRDMACRTTLKGYGIVEQGIGNREALAATAIKSSLGITNDAYGGGVDENDIFIISIAKVLGVELITNEIRQQDLPNQMKRYKIPAVSVPTLNMLEYIIRSGTVF